MFVLLSLQGISSLEELWATNANYSCCTFRGNMIKVDAATGAILWRTYMAPDNNNQVGGFSGNSLWGSSPAIDVRRNQVYIATGNNYEAPEVYTQCIYTATGGNITPENYAAVLQCEQLYGQGNVSASLAALLVIWAVWYRTAPCQPPAQRPDSSDHLQHNLNCLLNPAVLTGAGCFVCAVPQQHVGTGHGHRSHQVSADSRFSHTLAL